MFRDLIRALKKRTNQVGICLFVNFQMWFLVWVEISGRPLLFDIACFADNRLVHFSYFSLAMAAFGAFALFQYADVARGIPDDQ